MYCKTLKSFVQIYDIIFNLRCEINKKNKNIFEHPPEIFNL
jgi:hypothetical protein